MTDVAGGVSKALAQGRALALVARLVEDAHVAALQLAQDLAGAVGAAIIDEDDFLGDRHGLHPADQLADPLLLRCRPG